MEDNMTEQEKKEAFLTAQMNSLFNSSLFNNQFGGGNNLSSAAMGTITGTSITQSNAAYANQLYNINSMQQAAYKQQDLKEILQLDIKHLVEEERAELMLELMDMDDERLMLFKLFLSR